MRDPQVSVFIRVRDEAGALRQVLDALATQILDGGFEVVVLDNESVDRSGDVARSAGARVFTLPRPNFGYGRALNLGIELCRGDIVVLLSAHSVPQSPNWLAELVSPLLEGTADAAFCRQIPAAAVSWLERRRFACFPETDTAIGRDRFLALCSAGADPYEAALFSNSACAVRRSVALAQPFRDLPYAEDRAFAIDLLMTGGTVAFRQGPAVSYERPITWRSAYRIAYRAQVSKRLIRELAATYTGCRFNSGTETRSRFARALLVVATVALRLVRCVAEPRGVRRQAALYAMRSSGATLGLARGSFDWRRHIDKLSVDAEGLRLARRSCRPFVAAGDENTRIVG
jgi:glycosyltransferase involved in cell wall biosynthesis